MASTSSTSRPRKAPKSDYIETDSGNKVSRRALISGTPNITLAGRTLLSPDVQLRGDLTRTKQQSAATSLSASTASTADKQPASTSTTAISIGKATILAPSVVLRPPARLSKGVWTAYPLKIGDNVFIGPSTVVEAAQIHSHVHIGARCVLQSFCIVRENVKILDDTLVPAGMVIPPSCVVGGRPARVIGDVGIGWGVGGGDKGGGEEWVEGGDLRAVVRAVK